MSAQPMQGRGLSLWWLPPPAVGERLQGVIDALASRLGSPPFRPHVTVEGGLAGAPEALIQTLDATPATRESPLLRQVGVGTAASWNRLLYLELERTTPVAMARVEICVALGRTVAPSSFQPHLSLAYGSLPPTSRQAMVDGLRLALPPFHPVALALVDTRGEVADWWELHRWPLSAAPVTGAAEMES